MKKIILLMILINVYSNAQTIRPANLEIQIITTDDVSAFQNFLKVGLDTTATDCLDPHLEGEKIPPFPPAGIFDAAFKLPSECGFLFTKNDFRNAASFPFTGIKEYRIRWQLGSGATEFTIIYNFPSGITANIKDPFGGVLFNQNIADSGSYTITFQINEAILTMNYNNVVIPVELTSFTASLSGSAVQLNWATATETNNSGFEIERKNPPLNPLQGGENTHWEKIGFVSGFGTTTEPKSYSFTDDLTLTHNLTHNLLYRLKQIDYDGSFTYSDEVEIEVNLLPKEFVLERNYPNPFNPSTKISWQSPVSSWQTLKIYDVLGNEIVTLVDELRTAGKYETEFVPASGIVSGIYFYQLKGDGFVQTRKMLYQK